VADVAELADALDSKFDFWRFQRVSLGIFKIEISPDFTEQNQRYLDEKEVPMFLATLSQKVSQI
jgi:hypothetical protein